MYVIGHRPLPHLYQNQAVPRLSQQDEILEHDHYHCHCHHYNKLQWLQYFHQLRERLMYLIGHRPLPHLYQNLPATKQWGQSVKYFVAPVYKARNILHLERSNYSVRYK